MKPVLVTTISYAQKIVYQQGTIEGSSIGMRSLSRALSATTIDPTFVILPLQNIRVLTIAYVYLYIYGTSRGLAVTGLLSLRFVALLTTLIYKASIAIGIMTTMKAVGTSCFALLASPLLSD